MENKGQKEKSVWKTIGLVVAGVLAASFARILVQQIFTSANRTFTSKSDFEQQIDGLSNDPRMGQTFSSIKTYFPSEYSKIRDGLADLMKSTDDSANMKIQAANIMHKFMMSHIHDMANAPSGELVALAVADKALMEQLRYENVAACADFAMRGLNPTDVLSDKALTLIDSVNAIQVRAAYRGMSLPMHHQPLAASDAKAFIQAMKQQGASDEVVQAFLNGSLTNKSVEQQCSGGIALYGAIVALPTSQGSPVMSAIILELAEPAQH